MGAGRKKAPGRKAASKKATRKKAPSKAAGSKPSKKKASAAKKAAAPRPDRFSEVLRGRRLQMGLTLGEIADEVGCAKSYLSLLENERKPAPSVEVCRELERVLKLPRGRLVDLSEWERTPEGVRRKMAKLEKVQREAIQTLGTNLDEAYRSGQLQRLIDSVDPRMQRELEPAYLPTEVPLINSVAAGYPTEFTDLGYPARVADEYVRVSDLDDPDAFAARVVGASMSPDYREGDIVVFSPMRTVGDGMDCFCRIEPDQEMTFKRVFFQKSKAGQQMIRLQPLNPEFDPQVFPREQVSALFAAVSVTRKL